MKLYQIILAVPDDSDAEDLEVMAGSSKGSVHIFSEGFIGGQVIECEDIDLVPDVIDLEEGE